MIHINRRNFLASIAVTACVPFVSTHAQDTEDAEGADLLRQIPGLKSAYGRRYIPADQSHLEEYPIEPTEQTPGYLLIMALEFESRATLRGVMGTMLNASIAEFIIGRPADSLTEATNPNLAEGNVLFFSEDDTEHHPFASLLAMPVDRTGYIISTRGEAAAVQTTTNAIAEFLMDSSPSDEPVYVLAKGVAVGGIFDALPDEDDLELLNGLVPMFDYDLLVSESPILPADATPEA